ncbi:hypothetical protein [Acrocarpospora sp. B8E8]
MFTGDLVAYCFDEGAYDYRITSYHAVHTSSVLSVNTTDRTNGIPC